MAKYAKKQLVWTFVHVAGVIFAAAAFEVFYLLCLNYFTEEWGEAIFLAALIGGSLLNAAVLAVDLIFYFLHREVVYKFCLTVFFLAVFFAVAFYALLRTGLFDIMRDEGSFEAFLERTGSKVAAISLFITLQFLQVVILPIPSTVTVVAGTAMFGPLNGSLYSLAGIVLGSLVAFLVGRYAGTRVVAWLIGKDTLEKWLKKIKGKDKLLLSAMFLLPVFPDDVLCFVAGISSMSVWLFLGIILVSRVLAIFTTSYSVTVIPYDTWWGLLIWGVLIVLVIILFVFLYKKSDAILGWIARKFHRETRVEQKTEKGEFTLEVIDPDGSVVSKGVDSGGESPKQEQKKDEPPR